MNSYKFNLASTADKPDILQGKTPKKFLKERYASPHDFGVENLKLYACYRLSGWEFNFREHLKRFVYKHHGSWREGYAPNKTMLRKATYGTIDEIVELKMKSL